MSYPTGEKLSASLKLKIKQRPTLTRLRSYSPIAEAKYKKAPIHFPKIKISLPKNFNGKEIWKGLLSPVRNQGSCGSCWAFASVTCLADKFNIQSMGKLHLVLSVAQVIICDWQGKEFQIKHPQEQQALAAKLNEIALTKTGACTGNTLLDAWRYLYVSGTPTEKCQPDNFTDFPPISKYTEARGLPHCADIAGAFGDFCSDYDWDPRTGALHGTPARQFRAITYYTIPGTARDGGKIEYIMQSIFRWGPVNTGMHVYSDFYEFDPKKEIYEWDGKSPLVGGHAIELLGWGEEENGKKFWWVRNSWGVDWGIEGYFKMIRGINNCQIEENVVSGGPDFFYPEGVLPHPVLAGGSEAPTKGILIKRNEMNTGRDVYGGGIDPSTGYGRRIMVRFPTIDFSPPITPKELPNFSKWIAGIDAIVKFQKKETKPEKTGFKIVFIALIISFVIILLSILFIFL